MNDQNPDTQNSFSNLPRRTFIQQSIVLSTGIVAFGSCKTEKKEGGIEGNQYEITSFLGGLKQVEGPSYLADAIWYEGSSQGDGFVCEIPIGALMNEQYIAFDMVADGKHMTRFQVKLHEENDERVFGFAFGVLNQCSLRMRLPLYLVDQNSWGIEREGAFLKPRCSGDRVDLSKVNKISFAIIRKSPKASKFCVTPVTSAASEVPVIKHPLLPKGKLIDEIGQSTIHEWEGKTSSLEEMLSYLKTRYQESTLIWSDNWSEWGGWKARRLDNGTGFFRTHHDGKRWWFIDPAGYYFWSAGIDCIRVDTTANCHLLEDALTWMPPKEGEFKDIFSDRNGQLHINYLAANMIRALGADGWRAKWAKMALSELRKLKVNTVGNWSEWNYAREASFPYVRPMSFRPTNVENIYRDFPDVYHADFEKDAQLYAQTLEETKDDPALIGYFMMNEPTWAFSSELPAAGMLFNAPQCRTREELTAFLKKKYSDDQALSENWKMSVKFSMVSSGNWKQPFTKEALIDLEAFSQIMVERYFSTLSKACREVDSNHLNLGIRYAGVPPKWAVEGMKSFDVFSMNCYKEKVPIGQTDEIHELLSKPILIGEWHFGALDVGLPSSGIGHVHTQKDRGKAYRVYIEDAAANPNCIGTHWFTLYDQSALGRFDGENYNIGFLDICHKPHKEICDAAIKSHTAIYNIADGKAALYADAPEYLPKLF